MVIAKDAEIKELSDLLKDVREEKESLESKIDDLNEQLVGQMDN